MYKKKRKKKKKNLGAYITVCKQLPFCYVCDYGNVSASCSNKAGFIIATRLLELGRNLIHFRSAIFIESLTSKLSKSLETFENKYIYVFFKILSRIKILKFFTIGHRSFGSSNIKFLYFSHLY